MSKSSRRKKANRIKKNQPLQLQLVEPTQQIIDKPESKFAKFLTKIWKTALIIFAIMAAVTSIIAIKNEWFKSDKEKADEQTIYQGKLNPPEFSQPNHPTLSQKDEPREFFIDSASFYRNNSNDKYPKVLGINLKDATSQSSIYIKFGGNIFNIPTQLFYRGVNVLNPSMYSIRNYFCNGGSLILGIKNNRMYVSTEFKALQNEQTMGIIEFNHWKVYKENALEYPLQNDTMFEVRDKQNKIAFAIKYGRIDNHDENQNGVTINGYFINDSCIIISDRSNTILSIPKTEKDWKLQASDPISKIESIF